MHKFTTILHEVRKSLWLNNDEYVVCDTIWVLSNKHGHEYCTLSKVNMSWNLDISRAKIFRIIEKLIEMWLVVRWGVNQLKTTEKWNEELLLFSSTKWVPFD